MFAASSARRPIRKRRAADATGYAEIAVTEHRDEHRPGSPTTEGTLLQLPCLEPSLRAADSLIGVFPRRALPPLLTAAGCALAAVLVWLTAYHLSPFEAIDQRTFDGFLGLSRPATAGWADQFSRLADPGPFALFAAALRARGAARRRVGTAIAVAVILAGANVSTQLLKPALAKRRVYPGIDTATWPSGHATAAMALALCLVLVAPARLRPAAAAVGGLFAARRSSTRC